MSSNDFCSEGKQEIVLLYFGYDINKLHAKIQKGSLGKYMCFLYKQPWILLIQKKEHANINTVILLSEKCNKANKHYILFLFEIFSMLKLLFNTLKIWMSEETICDILFLGVKNNNYSKVHGM